MLKSVLNNFNYLISRNLYSLTNNHMQKPKFIVLQGLDRSGKSSMTKFIQSELEKLQTTVSLGYPNRTTKIGQMINDFLTNKVEIGNQAIHLLFSANRWETIGQLQQTLESGKNIVCDRYWYSGVAYSTAKGLDFDWCIKPDQGLMEPDLIIYLKADPQTLSKRAGYGEERFERVDFQKKVGEAFDRIFQKVNKDKLVIVDVNAKSLEEVQNEVRTVLKQRL